MAAAKEKNNVKKRTVLRKKAAPATMLTPNEVQHMIAEAAYYRAQARGFNGDYALDDWLAAEAQIGALTAQQGQ